MKKLTIAVCSSLIMIMNSGCVPAGTPTIDAAGARYELVAQTGVITDARAVAIKDEGNGSFLGAIVGAVVGSTMGRGNGAVLMTLGSGLLGSYVGNEIGKSNAQELSVDLDAGQSVVVISKGTQYRIGQRVKIVKRDGRVFNVELAR